MCRPRSNDQESKNVVSFIVGAVDIVVVIAGLTRSQDSGRVESRQRLHERGQCESLSWEVLCSIAAYSLAERVSTKGEMDHMPRKREKPSRSRF